MSLVSNNSTFSVWHVVPHLFVQQGSLPTELSDFPWDYLATWMHVSSQVWSDPFLYSHVAAKKSANMERMSCFWRVAWKSVCVGFQLCLMTIKHSVWWAWDSNTAVKNDINSVCSVWGAFLLVSKQPLGVSKEGKIVCCWFVHCKNIQNN